MIGVETKEDVHPILEIVDVYLAKIIKTDYTIIKERKNSLEYLLYLLVCNDEMILREVYELGETSGAEQNKVEIALNILKKNMDTKLICEVIGLTHDELNIIKKRIE